MKLEGCFFSSWQPLFLLQNNIFREITLCRLLTIFYIHKFTEVSIKTDENDVLCISQKLILKFFKRLFLFCYEIESVARIFTFFSLIFQAFSRNFCGYFQHDIIWKWDGSFSQFLKQQTALQDLRIDLLSSLRRFHEIFERL